MEFCSSRINSQLFFNPMHQMARLIHSAKPGSHCSSCSWVSLGVITYVRSFIITWEIECVCLDAAVEVKANYFFSLFFITFIVFVTILITNVVIALILTVSQKIAGQREVSQYEINKRLLEDD
jgi:hypothetical protein